MDRGAQVVGSNSPALGGGWRDGHGTSGGRGQAPGAPDTPDSGVQRPRHGPRPTAVCGRSAGASQHADLGRSSLTSSLQGTD